MDRAPGFEALRKGRSSQDFAKYFLTLTTHARQTGLTQRDVATKLKAEIVSLEADSSWVVHGAVIMPDHLHLLVTLGDRIALGQTIGRLKSKTRTTLERATLKWQGNYFDHRIRVDEPVEAILRYMFLNPYRASLCSQDDRYEWFWVGASEQTWFRATPEDELPVCEWL